MLLLPKRVAHSVDKLCSANINFRSLSEPWADTTSHAGRMVMTIFAGIAEFERELIKERTSVGRHSAKKRGVKFGRPSKLNPEQKALVERLRSEKEAIKSIAKTMNVHPSTIYRNLEPLAA